MNSIPCDENVTTKNVIDNIMPPQPLIMSVNGVSAANQRVGIQKSLVNSDSARADAQAEIDALFGGNHIDRDDSNIVASPIDQNEVKAQIDNQINEKFHSSCCINDSYGVKPGYLRDVNTDDWHLSTASSAANDLIPDITKVAADLSGNEMIETFVRHSMNEDLLGSGKLNDAIIRKHVSDSKNGSNAKVVDRLLRDYVKRNPDPNPQPEHTELPCSRMDYSGGGDDPQPGPQPGPSPFDWDFRNMSFTAQYIILIIIIFTVIGTGLLLLYRPNGLPYPRYGGTGGLTSAAGW